MSAELQAEVDRLRSERDSVLFGIDRRVKQVEAENELLKTIMAVKYASELSKFAAVIVSKNSEIEMLKEELDGCHEATEN